MKPAIALFGLLLALFFASAGIGAAVFGWPQAAFAAAGAALALVVLSSILLFTGARP